MQYNLEERTIQFAENLITILKNIQITPLNQRLISQVVASSGSIGANYAEANAAESKKDFIHKVYIAKKEANETKHWLRLLLKSNPEIKNQLVSLQQEAHELLLIFSKIISSSKKPKYLRIKN